MSKVQCLRGLEPRDLTPRRSPLPVKRSVCRNLFGFVDHEALQKDMTQRLREICARDRDRWNFNFELSSPQDGVYEWRRVSAHDLPEFYRDSVHSGRTRVPAGPRSPVSQTPTDARASDSGREPTRHRFLCETEESRGQNRCEVCHPPRAHGENPEEEAPMKVRLFYFLLNMWNLLQRPVKGAGGPEELKDQEEQVSLKLQLFGLFLSEQSVWWNPKLSIIAVIKVREEQKEEQREEQSRRRVQGWLHHFEITDLD
uniref:Cyclin-dependent kinase inhibitor domain-containing protein n=1 Tax=Knipowitschia caucasica TaxID=637954 RepID=A0AAV2L4R6_KNICA